MKILILGGTQFLGRALTEAALAGGHVVTLFNRRRGDPDAFRGVETLRGDRGGGLDALAGRSWDVVIDTSGYVPRLVRASAELLAGSVDRYIFISSISVYANFSRPFEEGSPLGSIANETVEEVTGATYGPLKALCERAVRAAFPGSSLIVRPGVIVGPHDPTMRFSYWTRRVARGGEVLAPGDPNTPVQLIDVRDLAEWVIRIIEAGRTGLFNVLGPEHLLTMRDMLDACRAASGSDARFTWVGEDFLAERGVAPWRQLPLWMPASTATHSYFLRGIADRAFAAGLSCRPLVETARDTLAWQRGRGDRPLPDKLGVATPDETLTTARERTLLDEWRRTRPA